MKRLLLIVSIIPNLLSAQVNIINGNLHKESTIEMLTQVKLISQFIERFNYEKTFDDKIIDDEFCRMIDRQTYIRFLFNLHDPRLQNSDSIPSDYSQLRDRFIDEISNEHKPQFIDKYTDSIFARAECVVTYKGKPQKMLLILQRTVSEKKIMEWKIIGAEATFINIPQQNNTVVTIPPNSHETNFMSLLRVFETPGFSDVFDINQVDILSILVYEIGNKNLAFRYASSVTYEITAIKNWKITIQEFNRNDKNSGWLISDLEFVNYK